MQLLLGLTALVQVWSVDTGVRVESRPIAPPHHKVWFADGKLQIGERAPTHPALQTSVVMDRHQDRWLVGEPHGTWVGQPAKGMLRLPLPEQPSAVAWVPNAAGPNATRPNAGGPNAVEPNAGLGVVALTTAPAVLHYFADTTTAARRIPLPASMGCDAAPLHVRGTRVTFVCNETVMEADLAAGRVRDLRTPATHLAFDATGRRARLSGDAVYIERGTRVLRRIRLPKGLGWRDLAISGDRLVLGTFEGEAFEFNLATGKRVWRSKVGDDDVSVGVVGDRAWIAVDDSRFEISDTGKRRIIKASIRRGGWGHRGERWARLDGSNAICIAPLADDCTQRLMLDTALKAVALGPGQRVAFIGQFKGVGVWDPNATDAQPSSRVLLGERVHAGAAWAGALDGATALSTEQASGVVTPTGLRAGPAIGRWHVASAGQALWWATSDQFGPRRLRLWDLEAHAPVRIDPIHQHQVTAVVASPDRRWIATGDVSGLVVLWHAERREMQHVFRVGETVEQLVFDAQSSRLAVRALMDGYPDTARTLWPAPVLTPLPSKTIGVRQWRANQPIGPVALTPHGLAAGVGEHLVRVAPDGQVTILHTFDAPIKAMAPDGDALLIAPGFARGIFRVDGQGEVSRLPMRGRLERPERIWTDGERTLLFGRQVGAANPSIAVWRGDAPAVLTPVHPAGAPGADRVVLDVAPRGPRAELLLTTDGQEEAWLQTWDIDAGKVVAAPRPLGKLDAYTVLRGGDGALWVSDFTGIHRVQSRGTLRAARAEGQFPLLAMLDDGVVEAHAGTVRWWRQTGGKIVAARAPLDFGEHDITALSTSSGQVAVAQRGSLTYHGPTVWTLGWYAPAQ